MNYFEMNFSNVFLEKHGKTIYNNIIKNIKRENSNGCDDVYIEVIFKVAFLTFFGLNDAETKNLIEDFMPGQNVNMESIKTTHKKSIEEIQKCIQDIMSEEK